jgi:D-sedoheptulose 7-phosphate isomerase
LVKFAKKNKIQTIGFSGFNGGYLKKNCNISLHINAKNYGISEDAHHILMHIQLQYLVYYLTKKKLF